MSRKGAKVYEEEVERSENEEDDEEDDEETEDDSERDAANVSDTYLSVWLLASPTCPV